METLGYVPDEDILTEVKMESAASPLTRLVSFFEHQLTKASTPLKTRRARFLAETGLDRLRPDHNIAFSKGESYDVVREHIVVHKYLREVELEQAFSHEEAVVSWYDRVYLPIVQLIREHRLHTFFAGNTEADLYLWLVLRRAALEDERHEMGHISEQELIRELEREGRPGLARWLPFFRRKLDVLSLLPPE